MNKNVQGKILSMQMTEEILKDSGILAKILKELGLYHLKNPKFHKNKRLPNNGVRRLAGLK